MSGGRVSSAVHLQLPRRLRHRYITVDSLNGTPCGGAFFRLIWFQRLSMSCHPCTNTSELILACVHNGSQISLFFRILWERGRGEKASPPGGGSGLGCLVLHSLEDNFAGDKLQHTRAHRHPPGHWKSAILFDPEAHIFEIFKAQPPRYVQGLTDVESILSQNNTFKTLLCPSPLICPPASRHLPGSWDLLPTCLLWFLLGGSLNETLHLTGFLFDRPLQVYVQFASHRI